MNLSPTASSTSASSASTTPSSASNSTLHPYSFLSPSLRRRSVDTGGLNLVVNDHTGSGSGRGYGGWVEQGGEDSRSIDVAELVIAWKEKSNRMIDEAHPVISPLSHPTPDETARRAVFIDKLTQWGFDGTNLSLEDVLFCANLLFELLWSIDGMESDIDLSFDAIPPFLSHVSKLYREQSCYHNFQHALDVLQAMYYYLYQAGCVPDLHILNNQRQYTSIVEESNQTSTDSGVSSCRQSWYRQRTKDGSLLQRILRNEDIFALFIAAIGHDIGHPGVNNDFLNKAKTPVAELFSDRSVLETMHSTLLFQVMKKHGMGHLLDRVPTRPSSNHHPRSRIDSDPGVTTNANVSQVEAEIAPSPNGSHSDSSFGIRPGLKKSISISQTLSRKDCYGHGRGTEFKALLGGIILVTDMGVHGKWMNSLKSFNENLLHKTDMLLASNGVEENESIYHQTRLLLCQALIKCADISNPSRPPPACKNWSLSLIAEWEQQVLLEKRLEMPHSFVNSADPLKMIQGQINFLSAFTLPLLQETELAIPVMSVFSQQCRSNIYMWGTKKKEILTKAISGTYDMEIAISSDVQPPSSSSPIDISLPTALPDITTMFSLAIPPSLQISSPDVSWTQESSAPAIRSSEQEALTSAQLSVEEDINGTSSSEPSSPVVEATGLLLGRLHLSHTELPQVSIPSEQSASSASSGFHQIKTGSTVYSSPLFSPGSTTTSSSTSRSEVSSPSPSNAKNPRPDDLRAVLDAHQGRSKVRRWHRRSWHDVPQSTPAASHISVAATSLTSSDNVGNAANSANGS